MFRHRQQMQQIETLQRRVRDLEGLVDDLASRAGVSAAELRELRSTVGPQLPEECRRMVADGRYIEAIKVYREHTGAGLKDAKDAIDQHRAVSG